MEETAKLVLAGMDPVEFLTTEDHALRLVLQATAQRVFEIRAEESKS